MHKTASHKSTLTIVLPFKPTEGEHPWCNKQPIIPIFLLLEIWLFLSEVHEIFQDRLYCFDFDPVVRYSTSAAAQKVAQAHSPVGYGKQNQF